MEQVKPEQTTYLWKLVKKEQWGEEIVNWGFHEFVELFISDVVPEAGDNTIDRDMDKMQDLIDKFYPNEGYVFSYVQVLVDLEGMRVCIGMEE